MKTGEREHYVRDVSMRVRGSCPRDATRNSSVLCGSSPMRQFSEAETAELNTVKRRLFIVRLCTVISLHFLFSSG